MEAKKFLMLLKVEYSQKRKQGKRLTSILDEVFDNKQIKILTPKEMLQSLPIALTQVKTGNKPKNLLNESRQVLYSMYQEKAVTKKVYNNIMNSIKL